MNILTGRKKWIKETLELLPCKVGSDFLMPLIEWLFNHSMITPILKKQYAKNEAKKILSAMENGCGQATIVYDDFVSPPTYGDYLCVVLLARYFIAKGIKVNFLIVDSEYRQDWNFTEIGIEEFVLEQSKVAKTLLRSPLAEIQRISWNDYRIEALSISSGSITPFLKNVQNRASIYNHCFNLLNQLLDNIEHDLLERILFSYDELVHDVVVYPEKPYITWACRHSELWGYERNTASEEFLRSHAILRQLFPDHSIMVISDKGGCSFFAELAEAHHLNCIFSKKYSSSVIGDGALILNSDFYFQIRGGGIGIIPMFSNVPYEITVPLGNEVMWSKEKVVSWQYPSQLFVNSTVHDVNRYGIQGKDQ